MATQEIVTVTDSNFDSQVVKSPVPFLLDFWAEWCAPCRAIAPHVEALAKEYNGKIKVGKFDIDANPQVATQLEIRSIPTLLMFRGGQVVGQLVGAVPRARIDELIKKAL
jgi:thioredoxin 1